MNSCPFTNVDRPRRASVSGPSSQPSPIAAIITAGALFVSALGCGAVMAVSAEAAAPSATGRTASRIGGTLGTNQLPETWFAGPLISELSARFGWTGSDRHLDIADWSSLPDLSGSALSCDSLTLRPRERRPSKTFFEIYQNRLYVRAENDTVHMNSWILLHGGGSDGDSPYLVRVASGDPALNDTLACAAAGTPWAVRPGGLEGSPIGFRLLQGVALDPDSAFEAAPQSGLFPIFDPLSAFRAPTIGAYRAMTRSGRMYLVLRSEDADGGLDPSIPDAATARAIADHVDQGFGTPEEIALRPKILTFHVNQAPVLRFDDPAFVPQADQTFPSRSLSLNLLAMDPDPFDPAAPPPVGGPSATEVLRWNVKILGLTWNESVTISPLPAPVSTPQIDITVPDSLIGTHVVIEVELCDCRSCEAQPGSGRCATYRIPITVPNRGTPPLLVLDVAQGTGSVVRSPGGPIEIVTVPLTDSLTVYNLAFPPRDTIPADSRIEFRWHNEPTAPDFRVAGYRYKLDEAQFVEVDSTVTSVTYEGVSPGVKVFVLQVFGEPGPQVPSREINRRFVVDYGPETWFAGPDTTALDARFGWTGRDRHLDIADWSGLPDLTGTLLSCDSLTVRPAERSPNKTFLEIYRDRLYVRTENDTVHMNSWVVVHGGGSDLDSPYEVVVANGDPALADTLACAAAGIPSVVRPAGLIGSPIGLHSLQGVVADPDGRFLFGPQSELFPNFDPTSVLRSPTIGAYRAMNLSGKVYLVMRSQDSDGALDPSLPAAGVARSVADRVDQGIGNPREIEQRREILTFYVNRSPVLLEDAPGFVPRPNQVFATRNLSLDLLADDRDPYDTTVPPLGVGGPSPTPALRWNLRLDGTDGAGSPVSVSPLASPVFTPRIDVAVPPDFAGTHVNVHVELCDCRFCETQPGSGRCVSRDIPIVVPDVATGISVSLISAEASPSGVRMRWRFAEARSARVERRTASTEWRDVGEVRAGAGGVATFEDESVTAGSRYAYRLVLGGAGDREIAGEVWIDVPRRLEFAIDGLRPNPSRGGDLTVHFSLPTAEPARLEILDLAGRRWRVRELSLPAGAHAIGLESGPRLPPGVYLVRLVQGRSVRVARAAVLE